MPTQVVKKASRGRTKSAVADQEENSGGMWARAEHIGAKLIDRHPPSGGLLNGTATDRWDRAPSGHPLVNGLRGNPDETGQLALTTNRVYCVLNHGCE